MEIFLAGFKNFRFVGLTFYRESFVSRQSWVSKLVENISFNGLSGLLYCRLLKRKVENEEKDR